MSHTCQNAALRESSDTFDANYSPYSLTYTSLKPGIINEPTPFRTAKAVVAGSLTE